MSIVGGVNTVGPIHTMECYWAIKRNEADMRSTPQMSLEDVGLRMREARRVVGFWLGERSRTGKSRDRKISGCRGKGPEEEGRGVTAPGDRGLPLG